VSDANEFYIWIHAKLRSLYQAVDALKERSGKKHRDAVQESDKIKSAALREQADRDHAAASDINDAVNKRMTDQGEDDL
jgi:flagellar capping protein FliD